MCRQAVISEGQPFQFSKASMEDKTFEFVIKTQVGVARLVMQPGQEHYKVMFQGHSPDMHCAVMVKEVDPVESAVAVPAAAAGAQKTKQEQTAKVRPASADRVPKTPAIQEGRIRPPFRSGGFRQLIAAAPRTASPGRAPETASHFHDFQTLTEEAHKTASAGQAPRASAIPDEKPQTPAADLHRLSTGPIRSASPFGNFQVAFKTPLAGLAPKASAIPEEKPKPPAAVLDSWSILPNKSEPSPFFSDLRAVTEAPSRPAFTGRAAKPPAAPEEKPKTPAAHLHRFSIAPHEPQPSSRFGDLRALIESSLKGGLHRTDKDLPDLYQKSGLGGSGTTSIRMASGHHTLDLLLALAGQMLMDLFVDPFRTGGAPIHFPHLHIDLRREKYYEMPQHIQDSVERKIGQMEKWSSMEKAHVLCASRRQTLSYVLAYALVRAKTTGRDHAVWIPLTMEIKGSGHANAVCLQSEGKGAIKVLLYDPNFAPTQTHWVHALKEVNLALPDVRKLLSGTGMTIVGEAELFGNGLQTALGTTEKYEDSSKIYTTHKGYPICGAVVHFLALTWLTVGPCLNDIVQVEAALSKIVAEPAGKAAMQHQIASMLEDLTQRYSKSGGTHFAATMRSRLDAAKQDWPVEVIRSGGSITVSIVGVSPYTYTW